MTFGPLIAFPALLIAWAAWRVTRDWTAPPVFFPLFWSLAIAAPLLFATDYPVEPLAVAWLHLSSLAVAVGGACAARPPSKRASPIVITDRAVSKTNVLLKCTVLATVLGSLSGFGALYGAGYD